MITIVILYFGINYLKGINLFTPTNCYYAVYENVDGLVNTNPIMIKGYQVGQVRDIHCDFTKEKPFVVVIHIEKDLKLPKGTVAELFDNGLLGGKAIQLHLPLGETHMQNPADTLVSTTNAGLLGQLAGELMPKINGLVTQADSLMLSIRQLTGSKELKNSLASIETTTSELKKSSIELTKMMQNDVPVMLAKVDNLADNFSVVSSNLKNIDFASTLKNVDNTVSNLSSFTQKLNNKEGSIGLLLNDTQLYDNANNLVLDLKQNPKRYVHFSIFGTKEKK